MTFPRMLCVSLLSVLLVTSARAQEPPMPQLSPGSARKTPKNDIAVIAPQSVALAVPKGTPLQVALEQELCVRKVGQAVRGRLMQPIYAFDQIVIPMGSEVDGKITKIESVSRGKRTLAALDADFTPTRKVEVSFDELLLADGRRFPIATSVTPGSGQVLQFVAAAEKKKTIGDRASEHTREAKRQAKQQWDSAMQQLKTPGRVHRAMRYLEGQLPAHRQFIPAGTVYFAELNQPLNFGSKVMTPQMAAAIGGTLPPGSVVHAWLSTPLTSASAHKGDDVQAVLSQPLLDEQKHLVLPQGSLLKGTVRQVAPARRLKKNGQLRIEFRELVPPDGIEQKVEATLEGVQAGKDGNVKLDSEGGAEATTPKTRYLATGISLALAAASGHTGDGDDGAGGKTSSRVAGGANGFKLVGMAVGFAVHSPALGYTMGVYGAGMSVYSNFLARGHEVVFPKNTAMEVGVSKRTDADSGPSTSAPTTSSGAVANH